MSPNLLALLVAATFGSGEDPAQANFFWPQAQADPAVVSVATLPQDGKTVRRIGVTTRRPDETLAYHLDVGVEQALVIASVLDDMPASESGLRTHDVIVSVEGSVPSHSNVLRDAVQANDAVVLVIRRGAKLHEIRVPVREVEVVDEARSFSAWLMEADPEGGAAMVEAQNSWVTGALSKSLVEASKAKEMAEKDKLQAHLSLVESQKIAKEQLEALRLIEGQLAREKVTAGRLARGLVGQAEGRLAERYEEARRAKELAAVDEVRATLTRERANVEARRAQVEALRGSLAKVSDNRANVENELANLEAASRKLLEKQKLLELKAGEAVLQLNGRSALVLPGTQSTARFPSGNDESRFNGIEQRLDEVHALTTKILALLSERSAR